MERSINPAAHDKSMRMDRSADRGRGGAREEVRNSGLAAGRTFTRYFWQLELDADLRPTGRDIVEPPGPPLPR